MNIRFDVGPLNSVFEKIYASSYITGIRAAQAGNPDQPATNTPAGQYASSIDWSTWKPGDPVAASVLKDGGLADLLNSRDIWIQGISDTTVNSIGNKIAEGLANGAGVPEISSSISQYLGSSSRADLIATTEVARAQNEGQSQELQGMGFGQWEWMAYDGACDDCMGRDGVIFDWGDPRPPEHPNCRCSITGSGEPDASAVQDNAPTEEPASDVAAAASTPDSWVSDIQQQISQLGVMPDFAPGSTGADIVKPTAEMDAWVKGAKDIGSKIGDQIDHEFAKTSGIKSHDQIAKEIEQAEADKAKATEDFYNRQIPTSEMIKRYNEETGANLDWTGRRADVLNQLGAKVDPDDLNQITSELAKRLPDDSPLKAELNKLVDLRQQIKASNGRIEQAEQDSKATGEAYGEAFKKVMAQIREIGGEDVNFADKLPYGRKMYSNSDTLSKELNDLVQQVFPKEWLEAANKQGQTTVAKISNRGFAYTTGTRDKSAVNTLINITSADDKGLMAHEFMHRMEYTVDGLNRAEWTFLHQRMEGVKGRLSQKLSSLVKSAGYGKDETALRDHFKDYYSGKIYLPGSIKWEESSVNASSAFEVMTTGIEDLVTGGSRSDYGLASGKDADFKAFVLGVLGSL